jgi:hypothetical protein
MKYRVYDTEQEALDVEHTISMEMGYSKPGTNAATGEIVSDVLTTRWAVPQQIVDGRWVFLSPNDEGEESDPSWWPTASLAENIEYVKNDNELNT